MHRHGVGHFGSAAATCTRLSGYFRDVLPPQPDASRSILAVNQADMALLGEAVGKIVLGKVGASVGREVGDVAGRVGD